MLTKSTVKRMGLKKLCYFIIMISGIAYANITGVAFKDFNADGTKQDGEPGVSGIIVKAYKNDAANKDAFVADTTTGSDGSYALDTGGIYPVRLEFELPDSNNCGVKKGVEYPSSGGTAYGTSVQFVKADGETHNFALSYPYDFSIQDDPWVFTAIMGSGDPLGGGNAGEIPGIIKFKFHSKGLAPNSSRPTDKRSHNNDDIPGAEDYGDDWVEIVKFKKVGPVGGIAYSRQAKKIFASAMLRRHIGLGPLGSGGIYMIDPEKDDAENGNVNFVSLDDLGFSTQGSGTYVDGIKSGDGSSGSDEEGYFSPVIGTNAERGLDKNQTMPSHDSAAYTQIGKLSLGDIDISEDGRYLYVVNLYDRKLYRLDLKDPKNPQVPTASDVTSYQIPDAVKEDANIDQNKAGEYRPYGLKVYRGRAYVGIVGSGQDKDGNMVGGIWDRADGNQKAYVYSMNLTDETWQKEVEIDLSKRDEPWYSWYIWTNKLRQGNNKESQAEHGIPIVGDIEFDNGGNMLISFLDIHAFQIAFNSYGLKNSDKFYAISVGDLMRAPRNAQCTYDEPAKENDKYTDYYDDNLRHPESSGGMLAGHHTSNYDAVLSTFMDPLTNYDANGDTEQGFTESYGTMLYDNTTGKRVNDNAKPGPGYEIAYLDLTYLGKANALGDMEALETVPPIEIGNLVWNDKDEDGIQDPDEPGIEGVKLILSEGSDCSNKIAETTTDANGNYLFNHTNVNPGSTDPGLQADKDYTVCIDASQFKDGHGVTGTPIEKMVITQRDESGNSGSPDRTDSDADRDGTIPLHTREEGTNNHSYDIGLVEASTVCLGDYVWEDVNKNGLQDTGEAGVKDVTVNLLDANGDQINTMKTDANGNYKFCNLSAGDYYVEFKDLPTGYQWTQKDAGNDTQDSDADPTTGKTDKITLGSTDDMTRDAGIYKPAEPKIDIEKATNGKDADTAADAYAAQPDENITWTYVIKNTGNEDLKAIKVTDDKGVAVECKGVTTLAVGQTMTCTATGKATESAYENIGSVEGTGVTSGQKVTDSDPSHYKVNAPGSWSGSVREDVDNDSMLNDSDDTPIDGVTIVLYRDTNGNGIHDTGETRVAGTTTDASGHYRFDALEAGDYIAVEIQPKGYVDVMENEGGADDDKPDNGVVNAIAGHVDAGEEDVRNDFVEKRSAATYRIGDLFWIDANGNGVYDKGETVIGNAKVELLDADGNVLRSTTTDENGRYHFDVPAGKYKVRFYIPQRYQDDEYTFVGVVKSGDETNKALPNGIVESAVEVGPGKAAENMTLDAAINCGCANVVSDRVHALNVLSILLMMVLILGSGGGTAQRDRWGSH